MQKSGFYPSSLLPFLKKYLKLKLLHLIWYLTKFIFALKFKFKHFKNHNTFELNSIPDSEKDYLARLFT